MQIFLVVKIEIYFSYFAQNIDFGYTLKPPRRGVSNKYPQSLFWVNNKKNRYTPANPIFTMIKVGFMGIFIACFPGAQIQEVRVS